MSTTSTTPRSTTTSLEPSRAGSIGAIGWVALVLMIIGSVNWGLVGVANIDLVATLFGAGSMLSRIVYALVGLAGLYGIVLAMKLGERR